MTTISTGILNTLWFTYDDSLRVCPNSTTVFVGIDRDAEPIYHVDMNHKEDKTEGFIFYEEE